MDFIADYQENGTFIAPFNRYVKAKPPERTNRNQQGDFTFRMYIPDPWPIARLTYDYYRYAALLEQYTNLSEEEKEVEKEIYWLKYQLSWLGLTYTPSCWIDYQEHQSSLALLTQYLLTFKNGLMTKQTQREFRNTFIRYALTSHPPLIPKHNRASITTINKIFCKLGLPYKIESHIVKGRTYWTVCPVDDKIEIERPTNYIL